MLEKWRNTWNVASLRGKRLEESLEYQQFVANVEEEEAWINEKLNLVGSEDYGDTLAAVQVLICISYFGKIITVKYLIQCN